MVRNDGGKILVWIGPDLVAALALAFEVAAEGPQFANQLPVCHAGTAIGTRSGT